MFTYASDVKDFANFQNDLLETETVCLDFETTGLDVFTLTPLLLTLKLNNKIYIFDCRLLGKEKIGYILELILSSNKKVIGHNLKFDLTVVRHIYNVEITNLFDTFIAEVLIYAGIGDFYPSLEDLVLKYCNTKLDKTVRISFVDYSGIITQQQLLYAAEDVSYLEKIYKEQTDLIINSKIDRVIDMEMKLVPVVISMELNGIMVDRDKWKALYEKEEQNFFKLNADLLEAIIDKVIDLHDKDYLLSDLLLSLGIKIKTLKEKKAIEGIKAVDSKAYLRDKINLSSPLQLKNILNLFEYKIKNTNKKTLVQKHDAFIDSLLKLREAGKKENSFGDNFLDKINPFTKRVHTTFNQVRASTGRFSSSNPNLQQIPRNSDYRDCFIASPGKKLICADFSQQELRILASITQEPEMVSAFKNNVDLHAKTASIVYGVPLKDVTKSQRQIAKSLNFATVYGTTARGLTYNFGYPIEESEKLLEQFWKGYPVLAKFMKTARDRILELGYSKTPLGRRRYFKKVELKKLFEIEDQNNRIKREGFNHIIQGCGADVTKLALINIYYVNIFNGKLKILLAVHDEIVCEADEDIALEASNFVTDCMKKALQPFLGDIPAEVDCKISDRWEK